MSIGNSLFGREANTETSSNHYLHYCADLSLKIKREYIIALI